MVDTNFIPAEVFPPGEYIREEIEARGWTQEDFATILNRPAVSVNRIINGNTAITPDTAKALAKAFGTSAEVWMNLESAYQLSKSKEADGDIDRRAKLFAYAPVNEMIKRRWIEPSTNVEVLESRVLQFYGIASFDVRPSFLTAARKSTSYENVSAAEKAWFARVQQVGMAVQAKRFNAKEFAKSLPALRTLCGDPENIRHVPKILAEWGVRFVVVEAINRTKIDGGVLWLNKSQPVIAITLRFDRIDSFWHTLIHETVHVKNGDANVLDVEIVSDSKGASGAEKPELELKTDAEAVEYLVPQRELNDFITRVSPFFSKEKIMNLANKLKIHPGIIVGQLHHRKAVDWSHSREMLLQNQIRKIVLSSATTDGWDSNLGPLVTE